MCFSDSDNSFDTPLDYTHDIFYGNSTFSCMWWYHHAYSMQTPVQSGKPTVTIKPGGGFTFLVFYRSGTHKFTKITNANVLLSFKNILYKYMIL